MHLRYLLYETPAWRDCDVKINSHLFWHESHCVQGPLPAFIVAAQSLKVSLQSFLYIHSSILFHGLQTDGRGIEVKCLHMQRASFQHQNGMGRNIYTDMPPLCICVCMLCCVVLEVKQQKMRLEAMITNFSFSSKKKPVMQFPGNNIFSVI